MRNGSVAAAVQLLCGAAVSVAFAAGPRATQTITVSATSFQPLTVTIKRGDAVVWLNKDPFPHTATAVGDFDSGSIESGSSWRHVFDNAGDHPYICTLHPNMKGMVHVE